MAKLWKVRKGSDRAATLALELARVNGGLNPWDRREKYERMAESAFTFYRGSAHLYYRDLADADSMDHTRFNSFDAITWILGDLHLNNFGAFCDGEGDIVFDLNDFDEGCIASYLYDVWRGAVSLILTGEDNGFDEASIRTFVDTFTREYLCKVNKYHDNSHSHYDKITKEVATGPLKKFLIKSESRNSREEMLDNWTLLRDEKRRFNMDHRKLGKVGNDDFRLLSSAISVYKDHLDSDLRGDEAYFQVLDAARRLGAGIGSLGTPRYYVLIRGESDDPNHGRILDLKQQDLPAIFPFLDPAQQSQMIATYNEHQAGKRVADAQRAMLKDPDKHLGWFTILGRSFSVRERSPFKKALKVEKLHKLDEFKQMAHHWGTILATCHSRGDDVVKQGGPDSFEREVLRLTRNRAEDFVDEVWDFARKYAKQVRIDHQLFKAITGQEED